MRHWIRTHATYANVTATAALFIALGGGAYATTGNPFAGSGGQLQGCVPKRGGLLRIVKAGGHCPHGTVGLRLDQTGPTGPKGAQGSDGAPGAAGPRGVTGATGPSNAYYASSNNTLATLSLPAGDYAVFGTIDYANPNTSGNDAGGCSLGVMGPGTITADNPSTTIPTSVPATPPSSSPARVSPTFQAPRRSSTTATTRYPAPRLSPRSLRSGSARPPRRTRWLRGAR